MKDIHESLDALSKAYKEDITGSVEVPPHEKLREMDEWDRFAAEHLVSDDEA